MQRAMQKAPEGALRKNHDSDAGAPSGHRRRNLPQTSATDSAKTHFFLATTRTISRHCLA